MSQFLHHNNNKADTKAIAIPLVFSKNNRAKNVVPTFLPFLTMFQNSVFYYRTSGLFVKD